MSEKLFKGKYCIAFYDWTDESCIAVFDNIWAICKYKKMDMSSKNYNLLKVELYRASKRADSATRMLTGDLMHVYFIDIISEEEDE